MKLISRVTDTLGKIVAEQEFPEHDEGIVVAVINDHPIGMEVKNLSVGENKVTIRNENNDVIGFWTVNYIPTYN